MARRIVKWDNWAFGEYERLEGWQKPPHNSFTGTNMMVYHTGELGVRPGLKDRTPAGLSNGLVHGFGMADLNENNAWFIQGTAVRTFDIFDADNVKTSATALSATPDYPVDYDLTGDDIYFTLGNDKVYRLTPQTGATLPTVVRLDNSNGGRAIVVYGDRLVTGGTNSGGFNIYEITFSEGGDFTSWPADNFIAVGDDFGVAALHVQRQHMAILKSRSLHVLTGVPGVNPVLRQISKINGPVTAQHSALLFPDTVWYAGLGTTFPTRFLGTPPKQLTYLDSLPISNGHADPFPPDFSVSVNRGRDNGIAMISDVDSSMLLLMNGVWTKHSLGVGVAYGTPVNPTDQIMSFCDGGAVGASPNFYVADFTVDRPGIAGSSFDSPGDGTDTTALSGSATFPEWWAEDGDEAYVRSVIVDFRKWDTGASNTNHFDLTVDAMRLYDGDSDVTSNTVSFDEAPGSSSATGTITRRVYGFGEQGPANGFQLNFTNVRGIAFHRVQVVVDTRPVRV